MNTPHTARLDVEHGAGVRLEGVADVTQGGAVREHRLPVRARSQFEWLVDGGVRTVNQGEVRLGKRSAHVVSFLSGRAAHWMHDPRPPPVA